MEWINCKKAMPPKHKDVLVWVYYEHSPNEGEFNDSWIDDDGWSMGSAKNFKVTHWMDIKPPKGEK
jgi:hypothetical protein